MQEIINQHLKTIRLGAFAQEERRQTAIRLGELLGSEEFKEPAMQLRIISREEADFVTFVSLQRQDEPLWQCLNEALNEHGCPPATTVKEARAFDVLAQIHQEQSYSVKVAAAESLVFYGERHPNTRTGT